MAAARDEGEIQAAADADNLAKTELDRAGETIEQVTDLIGIPLAGIEDWRCRLREEPEIFTADCRREVAAWEDWIKKRDQARQVGQDLAPNLAEARTRVHAAKDDFARRTTALEQASETLAALERERAGVLVGRSADDVESELNSAAVRAQRKQEQSRAGLAEAREALTTVQGVVAARREALRECEVAAAQAQRALEGRLAAHGVSLGELREALKRDQDWVERERLVLRAMQDACDRSQELLKERERRVAEHAASEPPELGRDGVLERLELAAETLKAVQEQWGQLHGRIGEDDRRRSASREIRAELERQQETWELWESLNQLIGSASGGKFRNFAQGLTLGLLVAHANQHLRDLARRYELQRVPDAEMEIQVIDREMGDEVRSIHSLSGGESFLVSLALALGLASLASDRVEVESLFIDEGFGALDADSLDLAIASLDALYSLGRQVGVISHVGTLVERIGVKVQVSKQGGGRSRLDVVTD